MKNRKLLLFPDFIAVTTGMLLGYSVRFSWMIFPEKGVAPISPYIQMAIFAAFVWTIMLSINRLYTDQTFINPCFEFSRIIQSSFYSSVIVSAVTFFYRGFSYSRIAVGLGIIISFFLLSLIHLFVNLILKQEETRFLLIGNKEGLGFVSKRLSIRNARFREFNHFEQLKHYLENTTHKRNCVIICLDDYFQIQKIGQLCTGLNIPYFIYPKISQFFLSGGRVEEIDGIPVITTQTLPLQLWHNKLTKRFFDIAMAIVFLVFLVPVIAFIAIAIKIDSAGPVFFVQERIGCKARKFKILKFRTMHHGSENFLPYTLENDPRITKTGKFLRRFNLDEIPQLFNVLKGDMSIVGPRPISVDDRMFFSIAGFRERMEILPGMTGWAQIHGLKGGQIEPEERFRYDLFYAENWSIWLDFAIILFTLRLFFKH